MPRNYNTNGDQTGAAGSGRAYTPQVTPWERDDDDASVARRERFEHGHGDTRQAGSSSDGDGDVWNRQDLQPAYEVDDNRDDSRDPDRDNNSRAFARNTTDDTRLEDAPLREAGGTLRDDNRRSFARDTLDDTQDEDARLRRDAREPGRANNARTFARDTGGDTRDAAADAPPWDNRAWDRNNGVHEAGQQPEARNFGRMNDGLSETRPADRKH